MLFCNTASSFIFSGVILYFISGFFPMMPSPEQGRSQRTISNFPSKPGLKAVASFSLISILLNPHLVAFSSMNFSFCSEISQDVTFMPRSARYRLFPPGAAHRSRALNLSVFAFLSALISVIPSHIYPTRAELISCTTNRPSLN